MPEDLGIFNTGMCGYAAKLPNHNLPSGISTLEQNIEVAGYGISFLNANTHCLNKDYLAAHENGHGNGLYHGQLKDGSAYNTYKNYMIDYAMGFGYKNSQFSSASRGTVMLGGLGSKSNNRFSISHHMNVGIGNQALVVMQVQAQ